MPTSNIYSTACYSISNREKVQLNVRNDELTPKNLLSAISISESLLKEKLYNEQKNNGQWKSMTCQKCQELIWEALMHKGKKNLSFSIVFKTIEHNVIKYIRVHNDRCLRKLLNIAYIETWVSLSTEHWLGTTWSIDFRVSPNLYRKRHTSVFVINYAILRNSS